MSYQTFLSLIIGFFCVCVSACGQKGPLYLPKDTSLPAANTNQENTGGKGLQKASHQPASHKNHASLPI